MTQNSQARRTLAAILERGGPMADALKRRFDRAHLWRLCQGECEPKLKTVVEIEALTEGEIRPTHWYRKTA